MRKQTRTPISIHRETLLALQDKAALVRVAGGSASAANGCSVPYVRVREHCPGPL
jgi:hypothetical protein